jgi:hypothetical protein
MSTTPVASTNQQLLVNLGLKAGTGVLVGGLMALLVARKPGPRLFITGLSSGAGLGYAWAQNDFHLKHPAVVTLPASPEAEFDRYWKIAASKVPDFAKFK